MYENIRKVVLSDQVRIRLFDSGGNKPVLILLHGLANAIEIWEPVIANLKRDFRVIAFDLPGFGESDRPDADYSLGFFSRHVAAVVDYSKAQKINLIGYSLGGSIAIRYAAEHSDRVQSLVVAAPGGFGKNTHWTMRLPSLPFIGSLLGYPSRMNTALTLKLTIRDPRKITPELIKIMNRHAAIPGSWRSYVRTLREGVGVFGVKGRDTAKASASEINLTTLVIWGREDKVFPLSHSKYLLQLLPMGDLKILENCGHYPHWEYPNKFTDLIREHIEEQVA